MIKINRPIQPAPLFRRHPVAGGVLLLMLLIPFAGCREESGRPDSLSSPVLKTDSAGYRIPLFASATEQLNYAKSILSIPGEKSAALNVLIERFPDNRAVLGEARLELAYLTLGDDFRLAGADACREAIAAYGAVARDFADVPTVAAKAHWYMGWIHTDLLGEREKGLDIYAGLAEKYPADQFSRMSPVPWLDLIFPPPEQTAYSADDRHSHSWAGLALLEIVRYAADDRQRMAAFDKLWDVHRNNLATGYALREILKRAPATPELASKVRAFIRSNAVNPELNRDLDDYLSREAAPGTDADH